LLRVEHLLQRRLAFFRDSILRRLVAGLALSRRGEIQRGTPLTEFFAGDSLLDEKTVPNLQLVGALTAEFEQETDQRGQLSRIYIALREVLARPLDDTTFLPFRNRLLADWGRAASWYGLHSHVRSGVLAAAQSMALVRERLRAAPGDAHGDDSVRYPGGELASALYSISKHLPKDQSAQTLREALTHLEVSLADPARHRENLLAIRGSVFRRLGLVDDAVGDYEQVLALRVRMDVAAVKVGDAMAELGYGYFRQFRQGKPRKALDYLERGVEL
jgi:hypothetical protein